MKSQSVIRAIDAGHRLTKYSRYDRAQKKVVYDSFSSLPVPISAYNINTINPEYNSDASKDIKVVTVNEETFTVGKGIRGYDASGESMILRTDYMKSTGFKALLYGALAYMEEPIIDLLIIGIPPKRFNQDHEMLKSFYKGTHQISPGTCVNVKNVEITSHAYGSLHTKAVENNVTDTQKHKDVSLIIDIGYHTTSWITAEGLKPYLSFCHSHDGGIVNILRELSYHSNENNLLIIDDHLNNGNKMIADGTPVDLNAYLPDATNALSGTINAMRNNLEAIEQDIQHIYLVGGGAELFKSSIQEYLTWIDIKVLDDPIFANVRGFQAIGNQVWRDRQSKSVA